VAAASIAAGALAFDAMTPQIISVSAVYLSLILTGYWFPEPKASLGLAVLATPLIILGYWITVPDITPAWEAWLNRALACCTVWLTAIFVWRVRVLEQKLQLQIDLANSLSHEMEHRIGNYLQLVASYLGLQAKSSPNEESRRALELARSRVMTIGHIQRMLSHCAPSHMIDSNAFINALIRDVRSALPDSDKVRISVRSDSAELTTTRATALGALLLELINNALKHAFPEGMKGTITLTFTTSSNKYVVEFEDDGVGVKQEQTGGFGTQNLIGLTHLMGGSITCQPASKSSARPGTLWRLVIPA
jgi:two-component sensor histidine kinase